MAVAGIFKMKGLYSAYNSVRDICCGGGFSTLAHVTTQYSERCDIFDKNWFSDTVYLPFENLQVPCPKEFDFVLRKMYGENYMDIPPVPPQPTHGGIIFDAEMPYSEYFKDKGDGIHD